MAFLRLEGLERGWTALSATLQLNRALVHAFGLRRARDQQEIEARLTELRAPHDELAERVEGCLEELRELDSRFARPADPRPAIVTADLLSVLVQLEEPGLAYQAYDNRRRRFASVNADQLVAPVRRIEALAELCGGHTEAAEERFFEACVEEVRLDRLQSRLVMASLSAQRGELEDALDEVGEIMVIAGTEEMTGRLVALERILALGRIRELQQRLPA